MSLKTRVKVGRITSLSEARYCAGMGVDLLGFPVGEEALPPEQYRQMIEWVSGPELVLEVHHSRTLDRQYITENYPGHYIEIGAHQTDWLSDSTLSFIISIQPKEWTALYGDLMGRENIKYVELTNATSSDASVIRAIGAHFPVLVNVDSTDDLERVLALEANGISMMGSDEEKPGLKDYGVVADVLEKLEE